MDELTCEASALRFSIPVGPDIDPESWRLSVPARGGCFGLFDGDDQPIVLGTAASLRSALFGRLSQTDTEPSRRVDYRAVTRRVAWQRAYSGFESDRLYLHHVRRCFPDTYAPLVKRWRAHWVSIDPTQRYPRFTTTTKPAATGLSFGPLPTSVAARLAIETCQELFDLCRYHEILVQTPHGKPCAYKEMDKCPAPCDGTVSMDHYADQLRQAIGFCHDRSQAIESLEQQMSSASERLEFETAGRCKAKLQLAGRLDGPAFELWQSLDRMRWVTVQAGSRRGAARVFVITPGSIGFAGEIQPKRSDEQIDWLIERLPAWLEKPAEPIRGKAIERLGLVCWHLLRGQRRKGVWLSPRQDIDRNAIARAIQRVNEKGAGALSEETRLSTDQAESGGTDG